MGSPRTAPTPSRRARRAFWLLVVVAVLAAGTLSDALASAPSPATGARVAASGLLLIVSASLAARVLMVVDSATTKTRDAATPRRQQRHSRWKGNQR